MKRLALLFLFISTLYSAISQNYFSFIDRHIDNIEFEKHYAVRWKSITNIEFDEDGNKSALLKIPNEGTKGGVLYINIKNDTCVGLLQDGTNLSISEDSILSGKFLNIRTIFSDFKKFEISKFKPNGSQEFSFITYQYKKPKEIIITRFKETGYVRKIWIHNLD